MADVKLVRIESLPVTTEVNKEEDFLIAQQPDLTRRTSVKDLMAGDPTLSHVVNFHDGGTLNGPMAIFDFELEEWTLVDYSDEAMEAAIMPLSLEMEEPEIAEPSAEQLMIAEQEAKLIEAQNRIAELEEQVASLQRVNDLEKNLEELTRMVEKLRNKEE